LTAEAGASTRSYTSTFTHVCTSAVPPVTSLPNAVAHTSCEPGERPGVFVDQVVMTGPAAGVAGDVVSTLGAPPSTVSSTFSRVDPIRFGIRSGRSFGSGTATQVPPLTARSARSPSVPPVQAALAPIAIEFTTAPVPATAVTAAAKPPPPALLNPSDAKTTNFFGSELAFRIPRACVSAAV
jgi:hypothetical protein